MDNLIGGLIGLAAIVAVVLVIAFVWETVRRFWYWSASKMFGWSSAEKFEHETAWVEREAAKLERVAKRDEQAMRNTDRKRLGTLIVAGAVAALVFQFHLPWWNGALIVVVTHVGLTMASGLSFKW
jgi:hypothetical protein